MKKVGHVVRSQGLQDDVDNMVHGELSDVDLAKQSLTKPGRYDGSGGAGCRLGRGVGCANVRFGFWALEIIIVHILIRRSSAFAGFPRVISILPVYVQELLLL